MVRSDNGELSGLEPVCLPVLGELGLLLNTFIYATADEADAYMFYGCFFSVFFCFFPVRHKIPDNRSRKGLNGFS